MVFTCFYKNQKKNKAQRKLRAEINEITNDFVIEKINKAKSWLFLKINKMNKTLVVLISKKENIQITNTSNEKRIIVRVVPTLKMCTFQAGEFTHVLGGWYTPVPQGQKLSRSGFIWMSLTLKVKLSFYQQKMGLFGNSRELYFRTCKLQQSQRQVWTTKDWATLL